MKPLVTAAQQLRHDLAALLLPPTQPGSVSSLLGTPNHPCGSDTACRLTFRHQHVVISLTPRIERLLFSSPLSTTTPHPNRPTATAPIDSCPPGASTRINKNPTTSLPSAVQLLSSSSAKRKRPLPQALPSSPISGVHEHPHQPTPSLTQPQLPLPFTSTTSTPTPTPHTPTNNPIPPSSVAANTASVSRVTTHPPSSSSSPASAPELDSEQKWETVLPAKKRGRKASPSDLARVRLRQAEYWQWQESVWIDREINRTLPLHEQSRILTREQFLAEPTRKRPDPDSADDARYFCDDFMRWRERCGLHRPSKQQQQQQPQPPSTSECLALYRRFPSNFNHVIELLPPQIRQSLLK